MLLSMAIFGLLFMFAEMFVPGIVLGMMGAIIMSLSIIGAFYYYGSNIGILVLLGSGVGVLVLIWFWISIFPKTKLGKQIMLSDKFDKQEGYFAADASYESLLGKEGIAKTSLRPAGLAIIDGKRVDVVTTGDLIQSGQKIKVVEVEGNRIVVKAI